MTIVVEGVVSTPVADVWRIVGDFAGLRQWHPDVLACDMIDGGGDVSRHITIRSGALVERLEESDSVAHRLAYRVTAGDFPEYLDMTGRIELSSQSTGATLVRWSATFAGDPPELERRMTVYYHERIGHLRVALARASAARDPGSIAPKSTAEA